jgi:peptidoglycan/LPS O-acetylase OafA/YrhL
VLLIFGCIAAILIWSKTVATAAKAGITQPRKRLLMIGFIVPVTFVAAIVFGPLLVYVLCFAFIDRPQTPTPSPWLYLPTVALAGVLFACRRTVDWILTPQLEVVPEEDLWSRRD